MPTPTINTIKSSKRLFQSPDVYIDQHLLVQQFNIQSILSSKLLIKQNKTWLKWVGGGVLLYVVQRLSETGHSG